MSTAMQKIVILGGPGDGLVIMETVHQMAAAGMPVELVGFLNDGLPKNSLFKDLPVFGKLTDWTEMPDDVLFFPALRKLKQMPARCALIEGLGIPQNRWVTLIHPTAILARDAHPGPGSYIGPYVIIHPEAELGAFLSVRNGTNIGHNCRLDDFAGTGPHACLSGGSSLGRGAVMSINSTLANNVHVGEYSLLGMGAAVSVSVPDYSLVIGNPGRIIQSLQETPKGAAS